MHIIWAGDMWDLVGEKREYRNGRKTIVKHRVAQFTSYDKAYAYLRASDNSQPGKFSSLLEMLQGEKLEFSDEKGLLHGYKHAYIVKSSMLPLDPEFGE
jgi:hypothetical protein|tara:strand:+ start:7511 stop:7807 length:297 start_codon:yes stop_codon:yes gene_type:complete